MTSVHGGVYDYIQFAGGGPIGVPDYLGTERANDEDMTTFDLRLKNCYMLAGWAVVFGTAGASARLVHGSWHGPKAPQRIGHAWVELERGRLIWEPIHAAVFDAEALRRFARMWDERTYDYHTARRMVRENDNFGRWHESRYP
jgi:hypothetical protein